ncbi:ABC transporter substrate-binding protein [Caldifermentibacillus hisashii]|uniref:ABC transporter substrate-binding protein n=1 Tax=Caldifermentibacillus hisashii TaxID=996558 RepID=UPI0022B9C9C8|nr:ABC transporter substrate-binding protein [Caldifermentibacillus hisashii]
MNVIRFNKNNLLIGIFMILSIFLLAACSGDKKEENSSSDNEKTENDSSANKYGGEVVVAIPQDLDYLDPHLAEAAGTREVMFNIYEGLLKVNTEGGLNPAIAESYEISEDGLTYTFKLRKGVKFHDGKELTAKDVVYSYSKLAGLETGEPLSSSFASVEKIESPDDHTVVITLKENAVGFLTAVTAAIIPENYEDSNTKPIGTGPFKFVDYKPGQSLIVEKNENYYVEGVPYLDKVEFRILPDEEATFLALQSGEIDIYPRIGTEKAEQLGDGFETISNPQNLVQLLAFNNKVKPFDDVKVRQAINYAVNVDEIIEGVAIGKGTKLGSNLSPVLSKYYNGELEDLYPHDTEKAKKLLEEAGYKDGFEFTITVPSVYPFHVSTAEVIVYQLEQIGVKAKIESVEWGVWLERVYNGREYESTIIGLDGKLDPYEILNRYISTADNNFLNFKNPKLDEVLTKAKTEINEEQRISLIKEAQKIIAEDAAAVFIMDPNTNVSFKNTVKGYQTYPIYVQDLSIVYLEK